MFKDHIEKQRVQQYDRQASRDAIKTKLTINCSELQMNLASDAAKHINIDI